MMLQKDSLAKRMLRRGYVFAQGALAVANYLVPRRRQLAVYYGGARAGDVGGPLVKVSRLREYFPETRWGYNIVYTLSNAPYLPAFVFGVFKRGGIPVVHNQNGVFYRGWYGGDWQAQNRRMAIVYHAADWVFYQSEFCRLAADRFLGPRMGPGEVLYNAVDTNRFRPAAGWPGRRGAEFTFLVTGKIGNHLYYRLESTIAGLKSAKDAGLSARLQVAGWVEAGARRRAEALASELGVERQVSFSGSYSQQSAPALYQMADAYVMTKHNDPCPNTVLEALATGLPVLYSDSGGVPELVGSEAGIALPCEQGWDRPYAPTAADIGHGMLRIAECHAAYAEAARQRAVERFDIAHWIGRHREVFERLREERK